MSEEKFESTGKSHSERRKEEFAETMLHLTLNKLPAGVKLIYRTNGKLFNLCHIQSRSKVAPSSVIELRYADDVCVCAHSEVELQTVVNTFIKVSESMGMALNTLNLLVILILSRGRCGLFGCITCYLVAMASADLSVILTDVLLKQIIPLYSTEPFTNNITLCGLIDCLTHAATDCSVWFTVAFTCDRFVAICCQKLKSKYCTWRTALVVITTVCVLSSLKNIPWYFRYEAVYFFSTPWFCMVKFSYYTSPLWKAFDFLHRVTTPLLPFVLILLLNGLTVRYILLTSRARRILRRNSDQENHKDTEMKNRRKSIILLFSISASFILLWGTQVVYTLHERIILSQFLHIFHKDRLPYFIRYIASMLQLLSSCSNTCIYVVTQSKVMDQRDLEENGRRMQESISNRSITMSQAMVRVGPSMDMVPICTEQLMHYPQEHMVLMEN
uniref:probable G-protein coupled receptor 139 n=1 Tax=Pristiophorus japonicus TaxID=55135 RepID=UPI00398E82C5